jgi:hypothetical protein
MIYLYLKELVIYVIEESEQKDGEISGQNIKKPMDSALRSVTLPLFPLVRGQRIQGTFPLDNNKKASRSNILPLLSCIYSDWYRHFNFNRLN